MSELTSAMRRFIRRVLATPCPVCRRRAWDREPTTWACRACGVVFDPARDLWRYGFGSTWWVG